MQRRLAPRHPLHARDPLMVGQLRPDVFMDFLARIKHQTTLWSHTRRSVRYGGGALAAPRRAPPGDVLTHMGIVNFGSRHCARDITFLFLSASVRPI